MDHISLRGTHYEAGLQWGRTLAKRGYFLLAELPFPLTRERRDFGSACLPIYQACFPEILEEIEGLALGQSCPAEELQAVLFSMYALPPACHCSCFAVSAAIRSRSSRCSICFEPTSALAPPIRNNPASAAAVARLQRRRRFVLESFWRSVSKACSISSADW